MNGVFSQMWIGNVTLHPFNDQPRRERAATPIPDGVAELLGGRRFANDGVVDAFVLGFQPVHHTRRAVDCPALFVAGNEQGYRANVIGIRFDERFSRRYKCRHTGFHIRRAAAKELAIALARLEGVGMPFVERAGGDNIGMAGKTKQWLGVAPTCPEVGYTVAVELFAHKTMHLEAFDDELLAAGVIWCDRAT